MKLFSNKSLIVYQLKFFGIKVIVLQIHTRVAYSNNNGNVNTYFDPLAFIKRIQRRKVSQKLTEIKKVLFKKSSTGRNVILLTA